MAGGVGSRFWPLSKKNFPKQFHDLLGIGESLLQMTYNRLLPVIPADQILVLTNESYVALVREQLPDVKVENIVAEPAMRNTAPCILLAALKIQKLNPNANIIVAPSDHYIKDQQHFLTDLQVCFDFADQDPTALLTMGIVPRNPNTGYGYIEFDQHDAANSVKKVKQFREKPNLETANRFVDAGNFLWNAGIFVWKVEGVIHAFAKAQPKLHHLFKEGYSCYNTDREESWLATNYPTAQDISVDYAIMENSSNVYVLPASFSWSDLGTWPSLYNELSVVGESVAINNQLVEIDSVRNIVRTQKDKKVVVQGLNDYIIVDQDDVLMILPKTAEQQIKQVRGMVMDKFGENMG